MSDVHVNRFETQYRLPPAAFGEQRRLDQVRTRVLDTAFRQALAETGIGENAELCIRSLTSAVRLRLNRSDESVTAEWSQAIAVEIRRALRGAASTNVVVYHSRRQALFDFAFGIARGDRRRAWAWRQLGLWRSGNVRDDAQGINELVTALCSEPDLLVPTLGALAEAGWLHEIALRVTETQWIELAGAALTSIGAFYLIDVTSESPSPRGVRNALRVLRRSKIAGAMSATRSVQVADVKARRAVAVLAVAEVEPTLLSTASAPSLVGIIATAIQSPVDQDPTFAIEQSRQNETPSSSIESGGRDLRADRSETVEHAPASESRMPATEFDARRSSKTAQRPEQERRVASQQPASQHPAPRLDEISLDERKASSQPIDLRRRALTRSGGLLFLINVVNELNLTEDIVADNVLGARPFTWVMHQLALSLAGMQPDDPAALAFAGLSPQTIPPSEEETPANELEVAALAGLIDRIVERLRVLLERPADSTENLLTFVCARRAEVVSDPGWIELRFSLDDVSTEIRRAGLDLDPGYVPWLGVVLRFIYE